MHPFTLPNALEELSDDEIHTDVHALRNQLESGYRAAVRSKSTAEYYNYLFTNNRRLRNKIRQFRIRSRAAEVHLLLDVQRLYRTYMNACAPITRLPVEILLYIFKLTGLPTDRDYLGWLRCSHVCSAWFKLARNSPLLWARSIGTIPSMVDHMLNNSGHSAPLTLTMHHTFRFYVWENLCALSEKHIAPRLRTLDLDPSRDWNWIRGKKQLDFGSFFHSRQGEEQLRTPIEFPRLQSARIYAFEIKGRGDDNGEVGSNQFSGWAPRWTLHAPLLRSLKLKDCIIDWTSQVLTDLCITLSSMHPLSEIGVPLDGLLNLLGTSSQTLERLELNECIPYGRTAHEQSLQPLSLPRLQFLHLMAPIKRSWDLKKSLVVPRDCTIHFTSTERFGGPTQLRELAELCATRALCVNRPAAPLRAVRFCDRCIVAYTRSTPEYVNEPLWPTRRDDFLAGYQELFRFSDSGRWAREPWPPLGERAVRLPPRNALESVELLSMENESDYVLFGCDTGCNDVCNGTHDQKIRAEVWAHVFDMFSGVRTLRDTTAAIEAYDVLRESRLHDFKKPFLPNLDTIICVESWGPSGAKYREILYDCDYFLGTRASNERAGFSGVVDTRY